jgi:hypothetical protein
LVALAPEQEIVTAVPAAVVFVYEGEVVQVGALYPAAFAALCELTQPLITKVRGGALAP